MIDTKYTLRTENATHLSLREPLGLSHAHSSVFQTVLQPQLLVSS